MHTVPVVMPLAEGWNGVGWSLLPFPNLPPDAQQGSLDAVSCTTGSACEAVGDGGGVLFAERWNGSSWGELQSMPDPVPPAIISQPGTNVGLSSLSCSSSSFCTAVGGYLLPASGGAQSFAERWDGKRWSLDATFEIAGAFATELGGVSCTSPSACVAVGDYSPSPSPGSKRTLAERWNGTRWSVERTPDPPGNPLLAGVSCASSRACVAVGEASLGLAVQPLVERNVGTSWSVERTPVSDASLQAVSCTSSQVCTAVGNTRSGVLAEQSVPASAKLTGIPTRCANAKFTVHVTGTAISSVVWTLDSKTIKGHSAHRGTRYVAAIRLPPGRHKLTVKVKFKASSQTRALMLRREVMGCSTAR